MRTLSDIYQSILLKVQEETGANSISKLSIIGQIAFVVATAIWLHEGIFYQFRSDQEELSVKQKTHNLAWYHDIGSKYQDGLPIVYKENEFQYEDEYDDALNPVKFIAINETPSGLIFKIAGSENYSPVQLPNDVIDRFASYIGKFKDAGTSVSVVSRPADQLKIELDVWHDPTILNAAGENVSDTTLKPIEFGVQEYLLNLPYNGTLSPTFLIDHLQGIEGVYNVKKISIQSKYGLLEYSEIDEYYKSYGGYFEVVELAINYKLKPV